MYYVMNVTDFITDDWVSEYAPENTCKFLFSYDFEENNVVRFGEVFFTSFTVGFDRENQEMAITERTNNAKSCICATTDNEECMECCYDSSGACSGTITPIGDD